MKRHQKKSARALNKSIAKRLQASMSNTFSHLLRSRIRPGLFRFSSSSAVHGRLGFNAINDGGVGGGLTSISDDDGSTDKHKADIEFIQHVLHHMPPVPDDAVISHRTLMLSCEGGFALFPLFFGMSSLLRDAIKIRWPSRRIVYGGVSAGAIAAFLMALDLDDEQVSFLIHKMKSIESHAYVNVWTHTMYLLRVVLRTALHITDNVLERVNGRVFIGVTKVGGLQGLQPIVFSHFQSKQQLLDTLMASVHHPLIGKMPLTSLSTPSSGTMMVLDGGASQRVVDLPSRFHTVPVLSEFADVSITDKLPTMSHDKWKILFHKGTVAAAKNIDYFLHIIDNDTRRTKDHVFASSHFLMDYVWQLFSQIVFGVLTVLVVVGSYLARWRIPRPSHIHISSAGGPSRHTWK